ncbi:MAG: helix-turn-helix transcriptional regulator [Gammaproteobacteria bacterium]|nr:helix-turn-helix transcriptional regulator [Gammaproteobacteria bacterium]
MPVQLSNPTQSPHIMWGMGLDDWRIRFVTRFGQLKGERKISQEILAERLGVKQTTISRWLNGKRQPDLDQFAPLAEALDVPIEWLLFGDVMRLSEDERHLLEDYRENPNQNKDALRTIARSGRLVPDTKDQASGQQ